MFDKPTTPKKGARLLILSHILSAIFRLRHFRFLFLQSGCQICIYFNQVRSLLILSAELTYLSFSRKPQDLSSPSEEEYSFPLRQYILPDIPFLRSVNRSSCLPLPELISFYIPSILLRAQYSPVHQDNIR